MPTVKARTEPDITTPPSAAEAALLEAFQRPPMVKPDFSARLAACRHDWDHLEDHFLATGYEGCRYLVDALQAAFYRAATGWGGVPRWGIRYTVPAQTTGLLSVVLAVAEP